MRISLHIDSATERELRDVLSAYNHATGETDGVKVGLNGPECYSAVTPPLKGREAWALLDKLADGTLLDKLVRADHGDDGFEVSVTIDGVDISAFAPQSGTAWRDAKAPSIQPFVPEHIPSAGHSETVRRLVFGERT